MTSFKRFLWILPGMFVGTSAAFSEATNAGSTRLLSMTPLDFVIVILYFVVVLGIGFYLKKYTHTGEEFFMAGRKMTAWIAGLSFISARGYMVGGRCC